MKILLDECVPAQVKRALVGHNVLTVSDLGWKGLENGDLLAAAEAAGFEVFVLADKNLRHQQNLADRRIGLVELWTNHRQTLERHFLRINAAVAGATPGAYIIVGPP